MFHIGLDSLLRGTCCALVRNEIWLTVGLWIRCNLEFNDSCGFIVFYSNQSIWLRNRQYFWTLGIFSSLNSALSGYANVRRNNLDVFPSENLMNWNDVRIVLIARFYFDFSLGIYDLRSNANRSKVVTSSDLFLLEVDFKNRMKNTMWTLDQRFLDFSYVFASDVRSFERIPAFSFYRPLIFFYVFWVSTIFIYWISILYAVWLMHGEDSKNRT